MTIYHLCFQQRTRWNRYHQQTHGRCRECCGPPIVEWWCLSRSTCFGAIVGRNADHFTRYDDVKTCNKYAKCKQFPTWTRNWNDWPGSRANKDLQRWGVRLDISASHSSIIPCSRSVSVSGTSMSSKCLARASWFNCSMSRDMASVAGIRTGTWFLSCTRWRRPRSLIYITS